MNYGKKCFLTRVSKCLKIIESNINTEIHIKYSNQTIFPVVLSILNWFLTLCLLRVLYIGQMTKIKQKNGKIRKQVYKKSLKICVLKKIKLLFF